MNAVQFKSYLKQVERDLKKENKRLLRKAADVVLKEARSILDNPTGDAPKTVTGNLKKGLRKEVKTTYARIGVKAPRGEVEGGEAATRRTAAHAWLVEHGHDIVNSKGDKVGEAKPHPFLKPAFENTKDKVREILSEKRDI
jgi:HK97 gp10 family phage protein